MDINLILKLAFCKTPKAKVYGRGWNAERAEIQRQRCLANRPWERSTGPRTSEGKDISKWNAFRHGRRSQIMIDIYRLAREAEKLR